jgi:transglutaminase-like putative cysteine protease
MSWSEYVQTRPVITPPLERRAPQFRWPAWVTDWEAWLTFALVLVVFLTVARSIDNADWVPGMPSLVALSFLALTTGLLLARVRVPEVILHLFALLIGAGVVLWLTLQYIDAPTLREGLEQFGTRWKDWIGVVRRKEPTSDNMPFVMGVLALTWISAYLCAWSIFRWRNAWVALIPAGMALLTNISYLPSHFYTDFWVFLFFSMLLVMRVHVVNKLQEWQRSGTPYPDFLSLRLLNVTAWVAIAALIIAWRIPQANEIGFFARTWERLTAPFTGDADPFVRLFSGIDAKREVPLHTFGDTLPLQGRVVLSSRIAAQVEFGEGGNRGRPLRVKVYDIYTRAGWKAGPRIEQDLAPLEQVQPSGGQRAAYRDRADIPATFVMESGFPKNSLPTVGQPAQVSVNSRVEIVSTDTVPDIDVVRSRRSFKVGDQFITVGSTSTASEEKLRAAGETYPQWVRDRYLQLPDTLPERVRQLARQITQNATNPYDRAKAIEAYLRLIPPSYDIRPVPPGRDAVDFFLFDEKKGYADYQASAMVVMLRAVGVPARLAVGYTVTEEQFDLSIRRYLLREKNAYAWPEVFFPGLGWVEFSPYGDAPVINRPSTDAATTGAGGGEEDLLNPPLGVDFGEIDELGNGNPTERDDQANPLKPLLPVLYVLLALVVVAAVAGIGVRIAWERGMAGLDYPSQLWEKTVRLATWLRLGPKPYQTPTEYSRALRGSLPDVAAGVETVADSYQRARYGHHDLTPAERERLDSVWPPLRNRLIRKVLRLK